ncbi:hypothetical protein PVAP13_9NG103573 [Panicum virgatum]|uniref:Secreted protein n=1 Tax=Panicum virgatum TaxID=38727 RepID=A0A8T0MJ47_PANVG|nr:hypothetical protein PVAP13_9NG103573 [Panicum virgatum]
MAQQVEIMAGCALCLIVQIVACKSEFFCILLHDNFTIKVSDSSMGPGPRLAAPLSQLGSARVPLLSLAGEPRVHISVRVGGGSV